MPVHIDDLALYRAFVDNQIESLQCLKFDPDRVVWHYTSGAGLLGVIESGTLWATQVSCLNDSTEVRYGSKLFRDALVKLRQSMPPDPEVEQMLDQSTSALLEDPSTPSHAPSMYFVTCFSEHEDDLRQWRAYSGGENGWSLNHTPPPPDASR